METAPNKKFSGIEFEEKRVKKSCLISIHRSSIMNHSCHSDTLSSPNLRGLDFKIRVGKRAVR